MQALLSTTQRASYLYDLLRELVVREVRVKYKRSVLGIAWSTLNPLLHLLVFYFLFQVVMEVGTPRFASFALTGLLAWIWFAGSIGQGAAAITSNSSLLRQPGFPALMLPAVTVTKNLVYYLLALPVLLAFLFLDGSRPSWILLALPLVIAVQSLFTLALAYLLAAVNAWFRDTQHLLDVFLRLMIFLSPVFYEATRVPEPYRWLYQLNPMVTILDAYRAVLMFGVPPDWNGLTVIGLLSGVGLYFGTRVYRRASVRTVDEL